MAAERKVAIGDAPVNNFGIPGPAPSGYYPLGCTTDFLAFSLLNY
jgi:hypothetical protein